MKRGQFFNTGIRKCFAVLLTFLQVIFSSLSLSTTVAPQASLAAAPATIGFHGRLQNASGVNVSGSRSIAFNIYASSTGGVALWNETQAVTVDEGFFSVNLGSVNAFPTSLDFNQALFLSIEVNGDGEMSPRVTLNSVPYAYTAGGVNSYAAEPTGTGGRLYYNSASGTLNYYDGNASLWKTLGSSSSSSLQDVTAQGNITTDALQFAGGTSTAGLNVQGQLTATSVSTTNLVATNAVVNSGIITNLTGTNATLTSLTAGMSTLGSLIAGNITVTSTATITNLLATNTTSTNLFSVNVIGTNATFTNLNAVSGLIDDLTVVTLTAGTSTITNLFATNGTTTNSTSTNLFATNGLFTNISGTTATFTSLNVLSPSSFTDIIWNNATGTNTTSTNLFVSSLWGTSASLTAATISSASIGLLTATEAIIASATFTNVTTTNLQASTANIDSAIISSSTIYLPSLGGIVDTQKRYNRDAISTGWATGSEIIVTGFNTFDVTAGEGYIRDQNSETGNIYRAAWPALNGNVMATGSVAFVYVYYNGGTPTLVVSPTPAPNEEEYITIASVLQYGGIAFFYDRRTTTNFNAALNYWSEALIGYRVASGEDFLVTSTRMVALTAGDVFDQHFRRFSTPALDTAVTGTFTVIWRDGIGGYNVVPDQTEWDNLQIDSPAGTLTTMTKDHFANMWVGRFQDGTVLVQYGQAEYETLDGALSEEHPPVPSFIDNAGYFVAQLTFKKGDDYPTVVTNIKPIIGSGSGNGGAGNVHNNLNGLQGGLPGEQYHLSQAAYDFLGGVTTASAGAVLFSNASSLTYDANNFYWSESNNQLSISGGLITDTVSSSNSIVTSTLIVSGTVSSGLNPTTDLLYSLGTPLLRWNGYFGDVIWNNATGTNTTTTNLFATNFVAENGQITDALLVNATATNLFFTNASGGSLGLNTLTSNSGIFNAIFGTNATFTAATTTDFFASTVSTTDLFVNGQTVCLSNGVNCTPFVGEADTLASVTSRGATTSVAVTFFGGVTSSLLNVTGTATIAGLLWTDATGTNTTGTNAYFANLNGEMGSFAELTAANATFTQATATAFYVQSFTATDAGITNATTTNLVFENGTGTNLVISNFLSSVDASFTNVTTSNIAVTNGDVTNLIFASATGGSLLVSTLGATNINATGTVNITNLNASSIVSDGTITTNATTTNATTTNGFITNLTGTNATFTSLNVLSPSVLSSLSWTDATGTNTTGTNAYFANLVAGVSTIASMTAGNITVTSTATIANLIATNSTTTNSTSTNGFVSNFVATNSTSTNLFSVNVIGTNATFTNLNAVSGLVNDLTVVSLTAGTSTITNLLATNGTTTNSTSTNLFAQNGVFTNISGANATFTSLNVLSPSSFTDIIWNNATGTNTTSTNLFVSSLWGTSASLTAATINLATLTTLNAATGTVTYLNGTGLSFAMATFTGVTTTYVAADNATVTNLNGTNATLTNATATSLNAVTGTFDYAVLASSTINVPSLGGTQYSQNVINNETISSGWISGGDITVTGLNTFDVSAGSGYLRDTNSESAQIYRIDWPASIGNIIPTGTIRYVYVSYNSGSPIIVVSPTNAPNEEQYITLANVVQFGGVASYADRRRVTNFNGLLHEWGESLIGYRVAAGEVMAATTTRKIQLSGGDVFDPHFNEFSTPAIDTSIGDDITLIWRDGLGGFNVNPLQTEWPNTQIDSPAGALTTMTDTYYANQWVGRFQDGRVFVQYGQMEYASLDDALAEDQPVIPSAFDYAGYFVTQVTFQKNGASPTAITSIKPTIGGSAASGGGSLHNNLNGLQGGGAGEMYHLSQAEHVFLTNTSTAVNGAVLFSDANGLMHDATSFSFDVLNKALIVSGGLVTRDVTSTNIIATSTLTVSGTVSSDLNPTTDLLYSLGTPLLRWNGSFGDITWANATGGSLALTALSSDTGVFTAILGTNATLTAVTTTNLFATTVSTTALFVGGQTVCLTDGTNCLFAGEVDTLGSVVARGATTSEPVTFFGGVTSSDLSVTNTANITYLNASSVSVLNGFSAATATIDGLLWTNATGVNTTTTNLFANNLTAQASTLFALTAGTVTVTSSASIVNLSGTGYTFTNGTTTNSTSTNAFVTNLVGTNATLTTLSLVNPITVTGISWVNATGTNTTSTNLATTNLTGTSATITRTTSTNSFATTASSTNNFFTTGQGSSLSLNVLTATTGTITNLLSTSSTISNLFVNTLAGTSATFSSLLVGGQNVCLTNGVNCPLANEIDTLLSVTNRGSSATATLTLLGGAVGSFVSATSFLGASSTAVFNGNTTIGDATSDLLSVTARINTDLVPSTDLVRSLGSATLRWNAFFGSVTTTGLIWTNATGTSVTTTNIFSSIASFSSLVATNATMTSVTTTNIATTNITGTNATFTNLTAGNINLQPSPAVAEVSWTNSGLVSTGIESVRAMQSFNGFLYAGQGDSVGDGDIRICDPATAGNALVCDNASDWSISLNNGSANAVTAFAVYKNKLYSGEQVTGADSGTIRVCNPATTGNTQKCDSGDWSLSVTTVLERITQLIVYEDVLYASSDNGGAANASVYYCQPELTGDVNTCNAGDWTRVIVFGSTYEIINGLVIYNNRLVALMGESSGDNDLLTCNPALSGNPVICDSATDWVRTINNGAGRDSYVSAAVLNSYLYLGTGNDAGEGDLQRCDSRYQPDALLCDATAEIGTAFDPGASITRVAAMMNYGGSLWFGTEGAAGNGDVYQLESSVASTSHDTASLQATYSFAAYNGYLYAGRGNSSGNGQVWFYQRPKMSSSRILFNTGTSTGSLWFEEEDQSSTGAGQDASSTIGVFKLSHSLVAEAGAYDLAEMYPSSEEGLSAGDVVAIDIHNPGKVKRTQSAYDRNAIGIVSTRPGFVLSGQQADSAVPVALAGRVPVKVTAEGGSIQTGDALAPSSVPGYAMKALEPGTIIGRALESYVFSSTSTEEQATVIAFVQTAYHFGNTEGPSVESILSSDIDVEETTEVANIIQPASSLPEISLPLGSQIAQGLGVQTIVVEELAVRGRLIVQGDTHLRGQLYFGNSLSGSTTLLPKEDRTTVRFANPMTSVPRIQVTGRLEKLDGHDAFDNDVWDGTYYIANITNEGFEIRLPGGGVCVNYDPCPAQLIMDWFAYHQELVPETVESQPINSETATNSESTSEEQEAPIESSAEESTEEPAQEPDQEPDQEDIVQESTPSNDAVLDTQEPEEAIEDQTEELSSEEVSS